MSLELNAVWLTADAARQPKSRHPRRENQYPSADRCLAMQVASIFASTDIEQRATRPGARTGRTGARRNPMTTTAPPRPAERHRFRIPLATGPAAAGEARRRVRAAIRSWPVPVEEDVALLLTSELVTNAVRHEAGQAVMLVINCSSGRLRVDVHDTSRSLPAVADVPADAETGRGLLLVETLSDEWGFYRTPAGKAVYFTLVSQPGPARAGEPGRPARPGSRGRRTRPAAGSRAGTVDRDSSLGTPSPARRPRGPRRAPAFGLRRPPSAREAHCPAA